VRGHPDEATGALERLYREEELFYLVSVNLPGGAALLQNGKAGVTETELPNPAALLTRQHTGPAALPKAFPGT